jgi:1,4-alpha-glucan branching enzyme
MKLCMVNAFYHPYTGGTEKHMWELGRRLARTESVHVITSQWECEPGDYDMDGVKVHRLPTKFRKMPLIYPPPLPSTKGVGRRLEELDRQQNFDAINLHGRWFSDYNEAVWYARRKGKLMVQTLHNQRPVGISPAVSAVGMLYENLRGKKVLRSADRIIAVSAAAKNDVMNYGIPESKFEVIHNGVDTEVFKPSSSDYLDKYKEGCDFLLVFVGRIIRQKGLHHLLDAMPAVLKEHPRTRLLVVGRGELVADLQGRARRLGIKDNVIFPGFLDEERLPEVYSNADIFVLPSLWEVLAVALVEALGCGAPLCVSDAGGNPEVVEHGANGLVFRKGDAGDTAEKLLEMLSDPARRREMGRRSRERALAEFDWEIIAGRTRDFYKKAIAEHYGGRRV